MENFIQHVPLFEDIYFFRHSQLQTDTVEELRAYLSFTLEGHMEVFVHVCDLWRQLKCTVGSAAHGVSLGNPVKHLKPAN